MFKSEVIGNIGADAEIKNVNGNKFCTFRVANTDKWTDGQGKEHSQTTWIDCIMNNTDSKVIPFLKQGVKVFVRGNTNLRVYSSPKDRMMKAGATINVLEVELCGGSSDAVPRELIIPENGMLLTVEKYYRVNLDTKAFEKNDVGMLIDRRGNQYIFNKDCWVIPAPEASSEPQEQTQEEKK